MIEQQGTKTDTICSEEYRQTDTENTYRVASGQCLNDASNIKDGPVQHQCSPAIQPLGVEPHKLCVWMTQDTTRLTFSLPMSPAAFASSQYSDHLPLCMLALAVTSAHSRALVSAEAYLVSDAFWYSFTLCLHHLQQALQLLLYKVYKKPRGRHMLDE